MEHTDILLKNNSYADRNIVFNRAEDVNYSTIGNKKPCTSEPKIGPQFVPGYWLAA
jgi:hypothetical protein